MIGFKQNSLAQFEIYLKARIKNYFLYEYGPILPFFFVDKDYFYNSFNQPFTLKEGAEKARYQARKTLDKVYRKVGFIKTAR